MKKIIIVLSIMCMQIYAAQRMPVKVLPTNNVSNAPKFTRPKSYSDPNLRSARSPQDRELMKQLSEEAARKGAERSGTTFQRSGSMASQKRGSISVVNPLKSYVSGLQNKIDTIHTVAKSRGRSAKVQGLSKTIGDILQEEGAIQEGQVTQATKAKIEATLGKATQIADPSKLKRFTRSVKKTFGYKGANKDLRKQLSSSKGVIEDADDLSNLFTEQKDPERVVKSLNDTVEQSSNIQTSQVKKVRKKNRLQFKPIGKEQAQQGAMSGYSDIKNNDVDTSVQDSMPELSNDGASSSEWPVYGPHPKPSINYATKPKNQPKAYNVKLQRSNAINKNVGTKPTVNSKQSIDIDEELPPMPDENPTRNPSNENVDFYSLPLPTL